MPLVALSDLKAEMRITVSTYDAVLARYLAQATAQVEDLVRYPLENAERVWERDIPAGTRVLALPSLAVTEIGAVAVDGVARASDTWTVHPDRPGQLRAIGDQEGWQGLVSVTYRSGYTWPDGAEAGNVPAVLQAATIMIARESFHAAERDPALESVTIPGVYSYKAGAGAVAARDRILLRVLARHILPAVA